MNYIAEKSFWETLLSAAKIRHHEEVLKISRILQDEEHPSLKYHKSVDIYLFWSVISKNVNYITKTDPIMDDRNDIGKEILLVSQVYYQNVVYFAKKKKLMFDIFKYLIYIYLNS